MQILRIPKSYRHCYPGTPLPNTDPNKALRLRDNSQSRSFLYAIRFDAYEGVDIIVQKDSINYCFQCKNQNRVYLSAFQEVFYGKPDNCNIPVVVTTGSIAKTAMLSGERHGIQSWDGKYLSKLIKDAQQLDEYSTDYLIDNFECK